MRILYFSDNSSDHNRRFLEKLSFYGHEVWFLDSADDEAAHDRVSEGWLPAGVRRVSHERVVRRGADPSVYEEFLPEFQSLLAKLRPELVHAGPVQGCGYVAARSGFHPLLVMSWGSDLLLDAGRNPEWVQATTTALNGADGLLCDCDAVRTAAQGFAPIPDARIAQFPWGVKSGAFSPVGPAPAGVSWPAEPGAVHFISTRSWDTLHGIDVLLEAFRRAHSENKMLRLMLPGDGPMAGMVHEFVARQGLHQAVLTPGLLSATELPGWFRLAHGYVSCAGSDGTSISLLEAMATGLPVLVTDIPSNREWVRAGENGWLAAAGSAHDFAGKLLRIAALKASEREAIGKRNQRIVAERADWDRNFPLLLDLYERLMKVEAPA
ncbi:MAG: glycosyltransferase family 4 protein [Terriglobales bacterium]